MSVPAGGGNRGPREGGMALYCFVFFYFSARGGGKYSVDAWRERRHNGRNLRRI